jgi:hypothetical protein
LLTASDAQESEHRVTAPPLLVTLLDPGLSLPPIFLRLALPAAPRMRVNSFGGLAILAAIRRASSLVSNLVAFRP